MRILNKTILLCLLFSTPNFGDEAREPETKLYRFKLTSEGTTGLKGEINLNYANESSFRTSDIHELITIPLGKTIQKIDVRVSLDGHEPFIETIDFTKLDDSSSPIIIGPRTQITEKPRKSAPHFYPSYQEKFLTRPSQPREFTAQKPPRIGISQFEDTNETAVRRGLGKAAVSMMTSFLGEHSQFSLIDRQNTDILLDENRRNSLGLAEGSSESLSGLDFYLLGYVSIIDVDNRDIVTIDARVVDSDGGIDFTANGSGEEKCLRQLVKKVGRALEIRALESEYGEVEIHVESPENVWIHLTPIPLESNDRAAPNELSLSLDIDDLQHAPNQSLWITDPKRIVIEDVLNGYYSLRLERNGYKSLGTQSSLWEVRTENGELVPYYAGERVEDESETGRYLVKVDRDRRTVIDRGFVLEETVGKLNPTINFDYPSTDAFVPEVKLTPLRVDRNFWPPQPTPDCLEVKKPRETWNPEESRPSPSRYASSSSTPQVKEAAPDFNLEHSAVTVYGLSGPDLEDLATGTYQLEIHVPHYDKLTREITLDGDTRTEVTLKRSRARFSLLTTQDIHDKRLFIEGQTTGYKTSRALSSTSGRVVFDDIPFDTYRAFTNIDGFGAWDTLFTPYLFQAANGSEYEEQGSTGLRPKKKKVSDLCYQPVIKSQIWIAGDSTSSSAFFDKCFQQLIDEILVKPIRQIETDVEISIADTVMSPRTSQMQPTPPYSDDPLEQFADRLLNQDLIVLDDTSLSRIHSHRELSASIGAFVIRGGVLVTFLSKPGQYRNILGTELSVESIDKHSNWQLRPGTTQNFTLEIERRKQDWLRSELNLGGSADEWRPLVVQRKLNRPVILERAVGQGYVIVVATSSDSVRRQVPEVWPKILRRAFLLAQYSMFRRYDGESGEMTKQAKERLEKTQIRL